MNMSISSTPTTPLSSTTTTTSAALPLLPRPPLLPWSPSTWLRWSNQGRLSTNPVPRSPFVLLKAPVSTLYEEKFGGDRNMFTVNMYCSRMNAISIRIGLVVDCTALDMEEFAPLPPTPRDTGGDHSNSSAGNRNTSTSTTTRVKNGVQQLDRRVRYFHNPAEWDDYDVDYQRLMPTIRISPQPSSEPSATIKEDAGTTIVDDELPLAPKLLPEFYRIVSDYLRIVRSSDEHSNSVIALFDARGGLGAASYLAACYMCHNLKAPVHAALEAVKAGSPPQPSLDGNSTKRFGLCDVRLMHDLQERFKGQKEIVMEGTSYPTWWWHGNGNGNDHADTDTEGDDGSRVAKESELDDHDGTNRKRKREGPMIIIPPYSCCSASRSYASCLSTSTMRDPILPPDVLEPIPRNSPKYQRAFSVLVQLTPPPQHGDPLTDLPLREELDMSIEGAANNGIADSMLECIKMNMDGYRVTWLATKGRRGLLLILSEGIFFMEQFEKVVSPAATKPSSTTTTTHHLSISRVVNLRFPTSKDMTINQHRTLLDVILVKDVEKLPNDKNKITYRFYVLDVLCIEGDKVWHKPLELRCKYLNEGVLLPRKKDEALYQQKRHQAMAPLSAHNYALESIKIRANEYFPMPRLGYVMKEVCDGVKHEAEGVRVVPIGDYYDTTNGECDKAKAITWRRGKNEVLLQDLLQLTKGAAT